MNWVLYNILSVELVNKLPDDVLELFVSISTDIIIDRINKFISNNITSNIPENKQAAVKLSRLYENINKRNEYMESDEVKGLAKNLIRADYNDVSADTDIIVLKELRLAIISILSEDSVYRELYISEAEEDKSLGLKVAYTEKMDNERLENVLDKLDNYKCSDEMKINIDTLADIIENNKSLFKNGIGRLNKATPLRPVFARLDKLKNILRGLEFLIPKLENSVDARSWRRC